MEGTGVLANEGKFMCTKAKHAALTPNLYS
jgi:hypothetical protein